MELLCSMYMSVRLTMGEKCTNASKGIAILFVKISGTITMPDVDFDVAKKSGDARGSEPGQSANGPYSVRGRWTVLRPGW